MSIDPYQFSGDKEDYAKATYTSYSLALFFFAIAIFLSINGVVQLSSAFTALAGVSWVLGAIFKLKYDMLRDEHDHRGPDLKDIIVSKQISIQKSLEKGKIRKNTDYSTYSVLMAIYHYEYLSYKTNKNLGKIESEVRSLTALKKLNYLSDIDGLKNKSLINDLEDYVVDRSLLPEEIHSLLQDPEAQQIFMRHQEYYHQSDIPDKGFPSVIHKICPEHLEYTADELFDSEELAYMGLYASVDPVIVGEKPDGETLVEIDTRNQKEQPDVSSEDD